jgi:hypothetical protein
MRRRAAQLGRPERRMSIFGLLVLVLVVVGIVGALRRPRELPPYQEVIDEPVSEPLPDELIEPLGDACVEITRRSLELLVALEETMKMLERKDGMAGVDAAKRFEEVEPLRQLIAEAAQQAIDEHGRLPEEAGWWLSFVLEKVERIGVADEGERVSSGRGGPVARGAVTAALVEVQSLLFACDEFASRMLSFDLERWVKDEIGRDVARAYARALKEAASREEQDLG